MHRFGKKHKLNIVAVYKKGKAEKLSVDNIRFVVDDYYDLFNKAYESTCGLILCMPERPLFESEDKSNITLNDRPEFIGNIQVINCNVDANAPQLKVKNYNYYKLDINSDEVQYILTKLTEEIYCFVK